VRIVVDFPHPLAQPITADWPYGRSAFLNRTPARTATHAERMSQLPRFENHDQQQKIFTTCYMCACRCGIKVTLENNKVRFIQGNPRHPVNQGVLCAKGNRRDHEAVSPRPS
jgi:anaerobic selenocysteine-containing dehydrogenase